MYHRLGVDDDPIAGDIDANFQVIQGTANAVYRFANSADSKIRPYLIGGVGLYNSKLTGDDVPDGIGGETDFGINARRRLRFRGGLGLAVRRGSLPQHLQRR